MLVLVVQEREQEGQGHHCLEAASMQPVIAEPSWLAQDVRVRRQPISRMSIISIMRQSDTLTSAGGTEGGGLYPLPPGPL